MPVNTPHLEYSQNSARWQRMRDCIAGEDAIKEAGTTYLPKLGGQSDEDYNAYRDRALFYGATGRTCHGLLGAIFRKDPGWQLETKLEYLKDNIDLSGGQADNFARRLVEEVLAVGRYGVLTDMPSDANGMPYLAAYTAENIINWRTRVEGSKVVLDQVILKETIELPAPDGFGSKTEKQYRVLELDESNLYRQRIFRITGDSSGEEMTIEPKVKGARLRYIPFVFYGPFDLTPEVQAPPLLALANVNISHYRTSADLEHGAHWTALPTPYVSGISDADAYKGSLAIGSQTAWVLPVGAKAEMLEFSGSGLQALEKRLQSKEQLMVTLGARLLEDQKRAAETAESKRIQYSGENSILGSISKTCSQGITQNMRWAAEWLGATVSDVECALNTDFFDQQMDPEAMNALVAAWQTGAISRKTMLWNFQKGEVLQPGWTPEDEIDQIENEGPAFESAENDGEASLTGE